MWNTIWCALSSRFIFQLKWTFIYDGVFLNASHTYIYLYILPLFVFDFKFCLYSWDFISFIPSPHHPRSFYQKACLHTRAASRRQTTPVTAAAAVAVTRCKRWKRSVNRQTSIKDASIAQTPWAHACRSKDCYEMACTCTGASKLFISHIYIIVIIKHALTAAHNRALCLFSFRARFIFVDAHICDCFAPVFTPLSQRLVFVRYLYTVW